jgi:molybdenum cofactor cytidylyltransferase
MGEPKLLLPWGAGNVLEATLGALRAGGAESAVVVVAADGPVASWPPPDGVRLAVNPGPARGMMSSVVAGLEAIAAAGLDPDPLLVTPGDLPALRAATVAALLATYRRHGGVVVPRHGGKRGHPLVLAPVWQARIPGLAATGGTLRQILELAAGAVREVAVDDPGAIRDVDTPEDYRRLLGG